MNSENEIVVLQGKIFTVELQSTLGSSNYGWGISSMPKELVLMGTETVPVKPGIAPVIQKFYFGVMSAEEINIKIEFVLASWSKPDEILNRYTAAVRIVPSDSGNFVSFSENEDVTKSAIPYGYVYGGEARANDVYACETEEPVMKYGYPCRAGEPVMKYGYPCGAGEPVMKYGYPCGTGEPVMKYGYPCGTGEPVMKYGYPCGIGEPVMKYGYPCGAGEPVMKYGYPCGIQDANLKYGYPCGIQDANLKYGYPCGIQDANLKYGYPCMETTKDARPYGYPYI